QKVREAANKTQCANNLKQIVLAMHNFHGIYNELPYARWDSSSGSHTWAAILLPFIEQDNAYRLWTTNLPGMPSQRNGLNRYNTPATFPTMVQAREHMVPIYFCPSRRSSQMSEVFRDFRGACGDYAVCNDDRGTTADSCQSPLFNGCFGREFKRIKFADITDGLSNTLFVGEKHVPLTQFGKWETDFTIYNADGCWAISRSAGPAVPLSVDITDAAFNPSNQFGSYHPGVVQFAFGDGRVQALRTSIPGTVLGLLANRADGQSIPSFD